MREIKFRAWDTDDKQMVSPDYIGRDGRAYWTCHSIPTSSEHVMQFTGLHDKNGKEIYEGDIVKSGKWVYIVKFLNDENTIGSCGCCFDSFTGSGFIGENPDKEKWLESGCYMQNFCDCEVIGNIHENPELMEGING